MVDWKNGHSRYICCISLICPRSDARRSASPTPSHPGRLNRVWVQAKIQGMARSDVSAAVFLRRAGREPMLSSPSSSTGVACD